ncbi:hypothetical protein LEP1GSC005_1766 [Leptospira santarosai str. ST188]|nr:hypothetical protein LEP1GSC005_1766 [Leptospira santarosai str. ST188]
MNFTRNSPKVGTTAFRYCDFAILISIQVFRTSLYIPSQNVGTPTISNDGKNRNTT